MARSIPTWKEKQDLLYHPDAKHDPAKLTQIGQAALEEGQIHEALEYFGYAKNEDGLRQIETMAKEEGDAFLLIAMEEFLEKPFSKDDWNQLAAVAQQKGKRRFAIRAYEKAENEVMLAKLKDDEGEDTQPS